MKSDLSSVNGWPFRPTPEELITDYLKPKMLGEDDKNSVIGEVNFCKFDPWELPKQAKMKSNDSVWYFICPRDFKYKRSRRLSNRTTPRGYWKPTGKHIPIKASKKQIGVKKTLVFYQGRNNKGVPTGWITHEYELSKDSNLETKGDEYTVCKLKYKSVEKTCIGPPNDHDMMLSTEMTASELSHPTFDKSSMFPTNATCDESISNYPMDVDLGGQSSNEMVVNSDVTTPPSKENDISNPVKNSSNNWNSLLADISVDDSLDGLAEISPEQLTELEAKLKALI